MWYWVFFWNSCSTITSRLKINWEGQDNPKRALQPETYSCKKHKRCGAFSHCHKDFPSISVYNIIFLLLICVVVYTHEHACVHMHPWTFLLTYLHTPSPCLEAVSFVEKRTNMLCLSLFNCTSLVYYTYSSHFYLKTKPNQNTSIQQKPKKRTEVWDLWWTKVAVKNFPCHSFMWTQEEGWRTLRIWFL